MKSCIAVMKIITARDVLIHYGGYDFMPSEKSIFRMIDTHVVCAAVSSVTRVVRVWLISAPQRLIPCATIPRGYYFPPDTGSAV